MGVRELAQRIYALTGVLTVAVASVAGLVWGRDGRRGLRRRAVQALEPPIFHTPCLPLFRWFFENGCVPHHVAFAWLVMLALIGLAVVVPRRPALVPRGVQNLMEAVLEFILSL